MPRGTDRAEAWRAFAGTMARMNENIRRVNAASAPPRHWTAEEDLVIYCLNPADKRQAILLPANDPRQLFDRAPSRCRAFYNEEL